MLFRCYCFFCSDVVCVMWLYVVCFGCVLRFVVLVVLLLVVCRCFCSLLYACDVLLLLCLVLFVFL